MTAHSIKRAGIAAVLATIVMGLWMACDAAKRVGTESSSASIERAKMCAAGGAVLSREATGCACPDPQVWDGTRCMIEQTEAALTPAATPPLDDAQDALTAVEPEEVVEPDTPPPSVGTAADALRERYIKLCKRARGIWHAQDQYCVLAKGELFVGRRPRDVNGRLSDDLCERSPFRGRFVGGNCRCAAGEVFSPTLGGCVAPRPVQAVTKWRMCESSLNRGKWDVRSDLCRCPMGKVWDGNLCQNVSRLSSRAICESAVYGGKWSAGKKACDCGPGRLWVDQTCQPLKRLTAEAACKSEVNAGRWLADRKTCVCPRLTNWDAAAGACR